MANRNGGSAPPETVQGLDVLSLVDLCRLLEVPVGFGLGDGGAGGGMAPDADDIGLKRELLELNRAYARIGDPGVRQTLLKLVKAAAR